MSVQNRLHRSLFDHDTTNTKHVRRTHWLARFQTQQGQSRRDWCWLCLLDRRLNINKINCFSDRGAPEKRATAFYKRGVCSTLIATVIGNKRFTSQGHPVLIDTVSRLLDHEIQVLSISSDLRCTMAEFSPQHIAEFSPNRLAELQGQYAQILSTVLLNLAEAEPDNPMERVPDDGLWERGRD